MTRPDNDRHSGVASGTVVTVISAAVLMALMIARRPQATGEALPQDGLDPYQRGYVDGLAHQPPPTESSVVRPLRRH